MLVEDDKSLREIYGVRLLAEGYDIVSAGDGEEALAMAIKERPQLIVSDVMMPKISGFDMLDILRSTTETKNIRVIMMTALSSEEQRLRGEQLGADRYLVKSQVGIEDVVRVVHEVLGDAVQPTPQPAAPAPTQSATPVPQPLQPQSLPPQPAYAPQPPTPLAPVAGPTSPIVKPLAIPVMSPQPRTSTAPQPPSLRNRVIQPLNDPRTAPINMNDLLDKELAKEAGVDFDNRPEVISTEQEQALINEQLNQFAGDVPTASPTSLDSIPTVSVTNDGTLNQTPPPPTVPAHPTPTPVIPPTPEPSYEPPQPQPTPQVQPVMPPVVMTDPATPPILQDTPSPLPISFPSEASASPITQATPSVLPSSMPTPLSVPPRPVDPPVPPASSTPPPPPVTI